MADQGQITVDPLLAAAVTLAEAEALRLQAELTLAFCPTPADIVFGRDLSPLGRTRS